MIDPRVKQGFQYIKWGVVKMQVLCVMLESEKGMRVEEGELAPWTLMQNHESEGRFANWNHLKEVEEG